MQLEVGDTVNVEIHMSDNASTWLWDVTIKRWRTGEKYRFIHSIRTGKLDIIHNHLVLGGESDSIVW